MRFTLLKALLAERFHLATHRESKVLDGYALLAAKGGLKIHPVEKSATPPMQRAHTNHNLTLKEASLDAIALDLDALLGRPVGNETHIDGVFDIDIRWVPDAVQLSLGVGRPMAGDATGPSLFDVLADQLGLKLEKRKITTEILTVDHADRTPTGN